MDYTSTFSLRTILSCLLMSFIFTFSTAQVRLVADMNTAPKTSIDTKRYELHESDGGRSFFVSNGGELWSSDGTTEGTKLVKRFFKISELEVLGDLCYFSAETMEHGAELWHSNGTAAGTKLLKDIYTGTGNSSPLYMTKFNGMLFFSANHRDYGRELWRTDGTAAGTVLVKNISPGNSSSNPRYAKQMGNRLFFSASTPETGDELWSTDGTATGTSLVKDIRPGSGSSGPAEFGAIDGWIFFAANASSSNRQLWKSNGTSEGTTLVKSISTYDAEIGRMTPVNDLVFFEASEAEHGLELWRSDGTAEGTFLVKDITPGPESHKHWFQTHFDKFTSFNGKLLFLANEYYMEPWISDGTPEGTMKVTIPGNYGFGEVMTNFHVIGDRAYFVASAYDHRIRKSSNHLFTAGTDGQMYAIRGDVGGGADSRGSFADVDGKHMFIFSDHYWITDGTPSGTTRVRTLGLPSGSSPRRLTDVNGTLYYATSRPVAIWKSNGTAATTQKILDSRAIEQLTSHNDIILFTGTHQDISHSLWRTDGTTSGTYQLPANWAYDFTKVNSLTFFSGFVFGQGQEIWMTDGTLAGTRMVSDIYAGSEGSYPTYLKAVGDFVYFNANNGTQGTELWRTNGQGQAQLVKDINPGGVSSSIMNKISFKGKLYFQANDGVNGDELWQTDGSTANTVMVKNIRSNDAMEGNFDMGVMTTTANYIFFGAVNEDMKISLWKSDGTTDGTTQLAEFNTASLVEGEYTLPQVLASTDEQAFFMVNYPSYMELWKTNGTSTRRVATFRNQRFQNDPTLASQATVKDNTVYFITSYENQRFLWRTDGTEAGTYQIPFDGSPDRVMTSGPYVYLNGTSQKEGAELFVIEEATTKASQAVARVLVDEGTKEILQAYPNPFNSTMKITVSGESGEQYGLTLLDRQGRTVASHDQLMCNVEHQIGNGLPPGMYVVQVRKDYRLITRKIIKTDN